MFPQSSIKRLRFAFIVMASVTLLALTMGSIAFVLSHQSRERFLEETTPLLIDMEQFSKLAVRFSSTSRQLETIDSKVRLDRSLARYRRQSDDLQQRLLDLAKHEPHERLLEELKEVVRTLDAHEKIYTGTLAAKIDAATTLATLRRDVAEEGRVFQDRLNPLALDSSLRMIDVVRRDDGRDEPELTLLNQTLDEVQLLSDISFATERFLHTAIQSDADVSTDLTSRLRETLAPQFRRLTQLVLKLGDSRKRQPLAQSLQAFNERTLAHGGIADQSQRLADTIAQLATLDQQRALLLGRMADLVDAVVLDARTRFFSDAAIAQKRSLMAMIALILISAVAFTAVTWIGWRLINRDIARRLDSLATTTVALAEGDLDVTIDQSGSDELADMARATEVFRRNALELRRAESELADRLIEVEDANRKLVDANAALDHSNAELAESELRYELAIKGSSAGIWDWDARTDRLFWSDRLMEIVGLSDQAFRPELSTFVDMLHPEDREMVIERRRQYLEGGPDYDVECRLRHEDGHYVWIRSRGQAVWDDNGRPMRMAGSTDDITDRKLAAIELAKYAKELERSNQELDDFAYIASHDLKEPLRAIYNHASFLIEDYQDKLSEDGENRLKRMIKLSQRGEQLIADLLYFSRLGRGEQTMEPLDLNDLIDKIRSDLIETLASERIRIDVTGPLPAALGHPAHITSLFKNLIVNGAKYNDSPEKVIEIGCGAEGEATSQSHTTFYVRDNGIGIDERFQTEIFRIFKRLNSPKTYGEGTGAGLTFAKKIVENHGGDIRVESTLGEGSTFFFTLQTA
ncbi:MAG: PAS domain-containing protein, partial [Pseudomonadota bacterium]